MVKNGKIICIFSYYESLNQLSHQNEKKILYFIIFLT